MSPGALGVAVIAAVCLLYALAEWIVSKGKRRWRRKGEAPAAAEPGKHQCPATVKVDVMTDMLLGRQATGHASVPVSELLDLLDPAHEKREKRHPLADPVTGIMPTDPAAYQDEPPTGGGTPPG